MVEGAKNLKTWSGKAELTIFGAFQEWIKTDWQRKLSTSLKKKNKNEWMMNDNKRYWTNMNWQELANTNWLESNSEKLSQN